MSGLKAIASTLAVCVLLGTFGANSWSQQTPPPAQPQVQEALPAAPQSENTPRTHAYVTHDYSKSVKPFPNVLAPYKARPVPEPDFANTPRIDQLMRDGKICLSMEDAVALALENNLDLVLARYNLNIADTDILRADAGANVLGVNTGIVQNTPGGGVGGLSGNVGSGTGGTSVAAGGVGTGTNGLVSSTLGIGAPITSFDPIVSGTLQMDRNFTQSTSVFSPVPIANTNTGTAD